MYDYLIQLQVNNQDDIIILSDRQGIEEFKCEKSPPKPRSNFTPETINHNIDRRELVRKLKAMTEYLIYITFNHEQHTITLQGITMHEKSTYFCTSDAADTKEQTFGLWNWFK